MGNKKKTSMPINKTSNKNANNQDKSRKSLTPKQKKTIIIVSVSVLLLVAIALSSIFLVIIPMWKTDKNFDYLTSDLSKYIDLTPEQYKNYSTSLTIAKPRDIDVDIALLSMLAYDRNEKAEYDGLAQRDVPVAAGHVINIYYRGYIEVDGIQKTVVSNFKEKSPSAFVIGGGAFPDSNYPVRGVDVELLGKVPSDYNKFEKIKSGTVKEGQIIYLTFERLAEGEDESNTESGTFERIDLTSDKLDEAYGVGFKDKMIGKEIGDGFTYTFTTTLEGKSCTYSNARIEFATECERDGEKPVLTVSGYYPYNTGSEILNNKDVTFEIYLQSTQVYNAPELNDEYIDKKVMEVNSGLTMDELLAYEGETHVDKYKAYIWEYLNNQYEETLRSKIATEMWTYYINTAQIKRVPGIKVDKIYLEYYDEVQKAFDASGGVVYNENTEETESYDDIADYAKIYLGLYNSTEDWRVVIEAIAEDLVIERMLVYYIMQSEGITLTEEQLSAKISEIKTDYMEEYIYQYLVDFESMRDEFESSSEKADKEYAEKMDRIIEAWKSCDQDDSEFIEFYKARESEMFSYYDENYFLEQAYYELVTDYVISWATYTTLDDAEAK